MPSVNHKWYIVARGGIIRISGADIAFDDWTLTGYFASRICTIRIVLDAKTSFKDRAVAFFDSFKVAQPIAIAA